MADVWAENRQGRVRIDTENLAWFGERVLKAIGRPEATLSVVVTDAGGIRVFNRDYLNRDRPTNVISFSMSEGEHIAGDDAYLGDVVLSVDAAMDESVKFGYDPGEMLLLYLIHGILHLSGYDHEGVDEATAKEMEEKQVELLRALSPLLAIHPLTVFCEPE